MKKTKLIVALSIIMIFAFALTFVGCNTDVTTHKHTLVEVAAKQATCTEEGNINYWKCSDASCGKLFSDSEGKTEITATDVVVPVTHDWQQTWTNDANGHWHACSNCGAKSNEASHTEKVLAGKAANCTEKGLTEGKVCSICEFVLVEQTEIPTNDTHVDADGDYMCDLCETVLSTTNMVKGENYSDLVGTMPENIMDPGRFDAELVRYNKSGTMFADPAVIQVTDEQSEYYGKFILFGTGTTTNFSCFVSDDMMNWENVGDAAFRPNSASWGTTYLWAPEVTYDAETGLYYLFYSAMWRAKQADTYDGKWAVALNVAVSESPVGPYVEYNEYLYKNGNSEFASLQDALSAPTYDPYLFGQNFTLDGAATGEVNFMAAIDPHPFVDADGTKYLLYARDRVNGSPRSFIYMVEMEDWATPKYETQVQLTFADDAGYEKQGNTINEGPQLVYFANEQGTYDYVLQFSVNDYDNSSYTAGQAVLTASSLKELYGENAKRFEKVKLEDGGAFIYCNDSEGQVSGGGHHCLITVNGQMYALYHRHRNKTNGAREVAVDSVSVIKNSKGQTILHLNGATTTYQPKINGKYSNIAGQARLSVSEGNNVNALTDGLINAHQYAADSTLWSWIPEFTVVGGNAKKSVTVTLEFDDFRTVAGIFAYNSRNPMTTFAKIDKVEMLAKIAGKYTWLTMTDLETEEEYLTGDSGEYTARLGSAIIGAFAPVSVKTIVLTFQLDEYVDLGIQEIMVLGSDEAAPDYGTLEVPYNPVMPEGPEYPEDEQITLDGELDEEIYQQLDWFETTPQDASKYSNEAAAIVEAGINVKATTTLGEKGMYLALDVTGGKVYVDLTHERETFYDSGIQLYLGFSNTTTLNSRNYEISLCADGYVEVRTYWNGSGSAAVSGNKGIISKTKIKGGKINTDQANGYTMEVYFPWSAFYMETAPAALKMDFAIVLSVDETVNKREGWCSLGQGAGIGWRWADPSSYFTFGNDGYCQTAEDMPEIIVPEVEIPEIDGKVPGTVTFDKDSYKAYDPMTITVVTNEGFNLKTFRINGVDHIRDLSNGVYSISKYVDDRTMVLEVEFVARDPENDKTISGVLTARGGNKQYVMPQGKTLVAVGEMGYYEAIIGENGTFSITLPDGKYAFAVVGYEEIEIEVTESKSDFSAELVYQLITDTNSGISYSDDYTSVSTSEQYRGATINLTDDEFVLTYRIRSAKSNPKMTDLADGAALMFRSDTERALQYGNIDGKGYLWVRWFNVWTEYKPTVGKTEDGILYNDFAMHVKRTDAGTYELTPYIANEHGVYTRLLSVETISVSKIEFYMWTNNMMFDNIGYMPGAPVVDVQTSETENGQVTFTSGKMGEDVVITVTPDQGYEVRTFNVNGESRLPDIDKVAGGSVTLEKYATLNAVVEVTFQPVKEKYQITGSAKAFFGKSGNWTLPEGTVIGFVGEAGEGAAKVDANGKFIVELAKGEYSITIDKYVVSATLVVDGDANFDITAEFQFVSDPGNATLVDGKLSTTGNNWVALNTNSQQFYVTYIVKFQEGKSIDDLVDGFGFKFNTSNKLAQIMKEDGAMRFRWTDDWSGENISTKKSDYATDGIKVMVAFDNGKARMYYLGDYGWTKAGNTLDVSTKDGVGFWFWENNVLDLVDLSYNIGTPAVQVATTATEHGTVSVSKETIAPGGSFDITVKPDEGYKLSTLKVNGVLIDSDKIVDGVYTHSGYEATFAIDVEAVFVLDRETVEVSGVLTATAGASKPWAVIEGTMLAFTDPDGFVITAKVGANGVFSAQLPQNTEMTLTIDHYIGSHVINVGDAVIDNIDATFKYDIYQGIDLKGFSVNDEQTNVDFVKADSGKWVFPNNTNYVLSFDVLEQFYIGASKGAWIQAGLQFKNVRIAICHEVGSATNIYLKDQDSGADCNIANLNSAIYDKDTGDLRMKMKIVVKDNIIETYISTDGYNWQKALCVSNHTPDTVRFFMWDGTSGCTYTNFAYQPGDWEVDVNATSNDESMGTVDVSANKIARGESVTVTVNPADGYELAELKVNGQARAVEGNTLVIENFQGFDLDIEATFAEKKNDTVAISGTVTATSGASEAWNIPSAQMTFANGETTKTVGVTNGAFSAELSVGTYTVTLNNGYAVTSGELVVTAADNGVAITASFNPFGTDIGNATIENNNISHNGNCWVSMNVNSDKFEITYTVKLNEGKTFADLGDGAGFKFNSPGRLAQVANVDNCGKVMLRWCDEWSGGEAVSVSDFEANGVQIKLTYDNGTAKAFFFDGTRWVQCGNTLTNIDANGGVGFYLWSANVSIHNYAYKAL